jgi:two-component system, OmpR family, response regulator
VLELRVANLTLNLAEQTMYRGRQRVELSKRELTLLSTLMCEPGRVFTRAELCSRVWQRQYDHKLKLVEVYIGRLRRKIGYPSVIHTVRGNGYTMQTVGRECPPRKTAAESGGE